jgi:hypothetical protein
MDEQRATYNTTPPPPAASITIRVKRFDDAQAWVSGQLLQQRPGWVQVDAGQGPLWVAVDQVHQDDIIKLVMAQKLQEQRN